MKCLEDQVFHSLSKLIPELYYFTHCYNKSSIKSDKMISENEYRESIFSESNEVAKKVSITAAISMGSDSLALFYILYHLSIKYGFKLSSCHLNHGIRVESDIEQNAFIDLMKKMNVPYYTEKLTLPESLSNSSKSFESWARNERLNFFKKAKDILNSDYVATAHNKDDIIETFFFHLYRGTGLTGASSIPSKREFIIRPLLEIYKKELEEYLIKNNIKFYEDRTNKDNKISRNYIRNKVIPIIEEKFPNFKESITNFIIDVNKTLEFINSCLPNWFEADFWEKNDFLSLSDYLKSYVLYKKIKDIYFDHGHDISEINISRKNIDNICEKIIKIKNGFVARFSIFDIYIAYEKVYFFHKEEPEFSNIEIALDELKNNLKVEYLFNKFKILVKIEKDIEKIKREEDFKNCFLLKLNNNLRKILITCWEKGDKIKIKNGDKKLQDILTDWKIPSPLRKKVIVLRNKENLIGFYLPFNFKNKSNYFLSYDYYVDFNDNFDYILLIVENRKDHGKFKSKSEK